MVMSEAWNALNEAVVGCRACPRLVAWREQVSREKRRAYRSEDYWGKPVPGFGDRQARLLLVGLAPGAHGSNRTGRVFTGDSSGETLFSALYRAGFANQPHGTHRNDGLQLHDAFITAVARCAPPANKPTRQEIETCQPFLDQEWHLLKRVKVVLALGQIAFRGCVQLLDRHGYPLPRLKFAHGLHHPVDQASGLHLLACYHPSRQNTQTGRLTPAMLDDIFGRARALIDA